MDNVYSVKKATLAHNCVCGLEVVLLTKFPIQRLKERTLMATLFVMLWQLNPTNLLILSSSSGLTAVHVTNETVRRYQPEWN